MLIIKKIEAKKVVKWPSVSRFLLANGTYSWQHLFLGEKYFIFAMEVAHKMGSNLFKRSIFLLALMFY